MERQPTAVSINTSQIAVLPKGEQMTQTAFVDGILALDQRDYSEPPALRRFRAELLRLARTCIQAPRDIDPDRYQDCVNDVLAKLFTGLRANRLTHLFRFSEGKLRSYCKTMLRNAWVEQNPAYKVRHALAQHVTPALAGPLEVDATLPDSLQREDGRFSGPLIRRAVSALIHGEPALPAVAPVLISRLLALYGLDPSFEEFEEDRFAAAGDDDLVA